MKIKRSHDLEHSPLGVITGLILVMVICIPNLNCIASSTPKIGRTTQNLKLGVIWFTQAPFRRYGRLLVKNCQYPWRHKNSLPKHWLHDDTSMFTVQHFDRTSKHQLVTNGQWHILTAIAQGQWVMCKKAWSPSWSHMGLYSNDDLRFHSPHPDASL